MMAGMALRRVTIGDVAAEAGVSIATVSKVINDRYGVAQETSRRVKEIISELGFESSLVARSLRNRTTNVIAIVVADIEPFSAELLKGATRALRGSGYELIVYVGGERGGVPGWERRYLSRLVGTLADGAILVTPSAFEWHSDARVIAVDRNSTSTNVPSVDSDNIAGAIAATEYLIGLGHSRIGHLAGRPDLESAQLRERGYRRAMADAGLPVDEDIVLVGDYRPETSTEPAHTMLSGPDRPTAVFAANDLSAIETMRVAESLGLRVPDDVSVVGFDNIPESALVAPPLTTVDQSIQHMGFEAVQMIIALINGSLVSRHIMLPTRLVVRQSCKAIGAAGANEPGRGEAR